MIYDNKNILIIGGSFGIGKALCIELSRLGANLAIAARSEDKIRQLCKDLKGNNIAIKTDICKKADLANLANILTEKWTKIDLIIFSAGTYQPMNLDNFSATQAQEIIAVNFTSFIAFIDSFLPLFKTQKIAHLAVISSVAGYFGMANSLAYGASKAALSNLLESLFYELKPYKVKVQLINPGFVKTRLTEQNNFSMPNIINPKQAAQIIIKNLAKNKFEIKFPAIFANIMKLLSLLPYKLRFFLLRNVR